MWQSYTASKMSQRGSPAYSLMMENETCLKSFIQKKMHNWYPSQSKVKTIYAQNVNREVHFFENNFNTIANKLHLQKMDFVLLPGPYKVAVMLGVRVHLHLLHPISRLTLVDLVQL